MSTNLAPRFTGLLTPKGIQTVNPLASGLLLANSPSPTQWVGTAPSPCPTCNLVEIPYDPNLPVLKL